MSNLWREGPSMAHSRYQAAAIQDQYNGQVRRPVPHCHCHDMSPVHRFGCWGAGTGLPFSWTTRFYSFQAHNRISINKFYTLCLSEGTFDNKYTQKKWEWAHRKMKNIEVWNRGVKDNMKQLPMPLTGHCALEVSLKEMVNGVEKNVKHVIVIGGGTTAINEDGTFDLYSGPVPTSHVHLYERR